LAALACAACSSSPPAAESRASGIPQTDISAAAGANEAEIVIQRGSDIQKAELVSVFIDGVLSGELPVNSSKKFILPNGSHSVSVSAIGRTTGTQKFTARSNRIVFRATINTGPISTLVLTKESDSFLDPSLAVSVAASPGADSLAQACILAAQAIAGGLAEKARIAVVNIASADEQGEYAADEITQYLVNTKKFSVVDRRSLDVVRAEQKLQMSGEVDDDSLISLGKLTGAETVLTGSIDGYGDNRRLTVKALDVKTGEIQAMTSQKF
jgi:TolB-like protein